MAPDHDEDEDEGEPAPQGSFAAIQREQAKGIGAWGTGGRPKSVAPTKVTIAYLFCFVCVHVGQNPPGGESIFGVSIFRVQVLALRAKDIENPRSQLDPPKRRQKNGCSQPGYYTSTVAPREDPRVTLL